MYSPDGFPYGTFTVNMLGSLIIGLLIGLSLRNDLMSNNIYLILVTGFCGGFTTFSAFALENFNLIGQKLLGISFLYVAISVVMGILALAAGVWVSRFV